MLKRTNWNLSACITQGTRLQCPGPSSLSLGWQGLRVQNVCVEEKRIITLGMTHHILSEHNTLVNMQKIWFFSSFKVTEAFVPSNSQPLSHYSHMCWGQLKSYAFLSVFFNLSAQYLTMKPPTPKTFPVICMMTPWPWSRHTPQPPIVRRVHLWQ